MAALLYVSVGSAQQDPILAVRKIVGIKADVMGYTQGSGLRDQLQQYGSVGTANANMFAKFGPPS